MKGKRILSLLITLSLIFLLTSCFHTHTFDSEWSHDEHYHWFSASCEHDSEVSNKAEHTWDEGTIVTAATCEAAGTKQVACTACGYSNTITIKALGHSYGEPTYEWSGFNSCTASVSCTRNGCNKVITEEATITSEVTKDPTADADGERTFTATFANSIFKTQTKVAAEAFDHTHNI